MRGARGNIPGTTYTSHLFAVGEKKKTGRFMSAGLSEL